MNSQNKQLSEIAPALIVGLGSVHGDDIAGWVVAKQLSQQVESSTARVRLAQSPMEILHWLDGRQVCVICDASCGAGAAGCIQRWKWPCDEIDRLHWSGTHDVSLPQVLQLAERLGQLPPQVVIWSIEGDASNRRVNMPGDYRLSAAVESGLSQISESIVGELLERTRHA